MEFYAKIALTDYGHEVITTKAESIEKMHDKIIFIKQQRRAELLSVWKTDGHKKIILY